MLKSVVNWVRNRLVTQGVLRNFILEEQRLEISKDGKINLASERLEQDEESFWPKFYLVSDKQHVSLKEFYSLLDIHLFGISFRNASVRFAKRIKSIFNPSYRQALSTAIKNRLALLSEDFNPEQFWKKYPELLNHSQGVEKLVQTAVDEALTKYQREMLSEVSTMTSDLVGNIVKTTMQEIEETFIRTATENNKLGNEDAYPDGVKFVFNRNQTRVIVFEQKPGVFPILYVDAVRNSAEYGRAKPLNRYRLSFPYIIFVIVMSGNRLESIYVAYSTRTLEKLDQKLVRCNLPNINYGRLCIGKMPEFKTVYDLVKSVQSAFFGNEFNRDWVSNYYPIRYNNRKYDTFDAWQELSKQNPNFALDALWDKEDSLKDFIIRATAKPKFFGPKAASNEEFLQLVTKMEARVTNALNVELPKYLLDNVQARGKYRRSIAERISTEVSEVSQILLRKLIIYMGTFLRAEPSPEELQSLQEVFIEQLTENYTKAFAQVSESLTSQDPNISPKAFTLDGLLEAKSLVTKQIDTINFEETGGNDNEFGSETFSGAFRSKSGTSA